VNKGSEHRLFQQANQPNTTKGRITTGRLRKLIAIVAKKKSKFETVV